MFAPTKHAFLECCFILLALAISTNCGAQLVPYDNFNSNHINPSKWSGAQGYDPDLRETVRQLSREKDHGVLHLSQTAYSSTADDSGGSGGIFGLAFSDPGAITEVSFIVRVNKAQAAICSSNDSPTVTDAEFRGSFFNTETSPTTQAGNVVALIDVERDQSSVGYSLTVAGSYARCDGQFCASQTLLDYRVLGSVRFGDESRLRIKWDQLGHRFIFQLNHDPEVVSNYSVSDSSPAIAPSKAIELARVVSHCTTAPRPSSSIDASFRAVYVNQ